MQIQKKAGDNTSEVVKILPTQIQDIEEESIRYIKHSEGVPKTVEGDYSRDVFRHYTYSVTCAMVTESKSNKDSNRLLV